jgi:hypothetical protein
MYVTVHVLGQYQINRVVESAQHASGIGKLLTKDRIGFLTTYITQERIVSPSLDG